MEFPQITKWDEKRIALLEKMKVLKPFRFNKDGNIIKMKHGDPIELKGDLKKDLYHQLKVCYPSDFDALTDFFEAQKKNGVTYAAPPSVAKASDVDILKGQVAQIIDENAKLKEELAALKSDNKKSGSKKEDTTDGKKSGSK